MISSREMEERGWWLKWPVGLADEHFPNETTTGISLVPSSEIQANRVPHCAGDWDPTPLKIHRFAQTFPGYDIFGDAVGDVGNEMRQIFEESGWLPASLPLLRCALFFEQRSSKWSMGPMTMPWTEVLLEAIRLVASGKPPTTKTLVGLGVAVPGHGYPFYCTNCGEDISDSVGGYCPFCGTQRRNRPPK